MLLALKLHLYLKREVIIKLTQFSTLPANRTTGPARYSHLCNSGTKIMGVTKHFLNGLRPTLQDEAHTWHCYQTEEPVARQATGYRGDLTLLNEHSIKPMVNDLLLYPKFTASLNSHQRNFSPQSVINTETHNQSMSRE